MWNRKELKAKGKAAFQRNYWKCVIVALILTALIGGGAASGRGSAQNATPEETALAEELQKAPREVIVALVGAMAGVSLIGAAVKLLVFNPLQVGCKHFFVVNSERNADLGELKRGFQSNYGRVVVGMFLRDLFIGLGMVLFIVPGVILAYSYRMAPYILAENPDVDGMEALRRSKQMMNGHKWNTFLLDLSFFGWYFLAAATLGAVNALWTGPYTEATGAELYKALKNA